MAEYEDKDYWWCPTCNAWIHPQQVDYWEYHTNCGTNLGTCQPECKKCRTGLTNSEQVEQGYCPKCAKRTSDKR